MTELDIIVSKAELNNIISIFENLQKINDDSKDIIKILWYKKGVFLYSLNGDPVSKNINLLKTIFKKKEDFISNFPADLEMTWLVNNSTEWVKQHKFLLNDGSENFLFKIRYDDRNDINSIEASNTMFKLRSITANQQQIMDITPEMARERLNPVLSEWSVDIKTSILNDICKMSKFNTSDILTLKLEDNIIKIKDNTWDINLGELERTDSISSISKSYLTKITPLSDSVTLYIYDGFILVDEKGSYLMFTLRLVD